MAMRKISTGAIIALVATGIFLTLVTSGLLLSSQNVSSNGTISAVNVGVYSDSACTLNCTSISWGTISPGSSATSTIYVKNTGTVPMTLTMTTTGWNPTNANGPIALSWNRESYALNANQSISAVLTLTVSSSINSSITTFNFNTVITGTG
jgi:hypothetical protein